MGVFCLVDWFILHVAAQKTVGLFLSVLVFEKWELIWTLEYTEKSLPQEYNMGHFILHNKFVKTIGITEGFLNKNKITEKHLTVPF